MAAGSNPETRPRSGLRLSVKRVFLKARLALIASQIGRAGFRAKRFAFLPPHIHLADPSIAADFAAGHVVLTGRSLICGDRSPFHLPAPSAGFQAALFGFGWLAHAEASENLATRQHARRLVHDFLKLSSEERPALADHPAVISRRVISWLTHSALLAEGADVDGYEALLDQLARDGAMLHHFARRTDIGMHRLEAALALTFHALALDRGRKAQAQAERQLDLALASLIAPDGASADRDAGTVALMAADLVAMLALYRVRQVSPPAAISSTLADMIAFLRMIQHPDGGLVLMNGGGRVPRDLASEVIRSRRGQPHVLNSAVESGFERVENGQAVLIADAGVSPRRSCSARAGLSALAFEFSSRADRIIVNCGMPPGAEGEIERAYRSAAAHSTLLMEDEALDRLEATAHILGRDERRIRARGGSVAPLRARGSNGETLTLAHRGFLEPFGYLVERHLTLTEVLPGLLGRDRFLDQAGRGELRRVMALFHLNPRIVPVRLSRSDAIVLRLPDVRPGHDQFLFEAPGHSLALEDSRVFEPGSNITRSHVIVLSAEIRGSVDLVWRLLPYLPELS
jgi:uncharacterized heparinase superfamily protein